jgi:hypothetical protein
MRTLALVNGTAFRRTNSAKNDEEKIKLEEIRTSHSYVCGRFMGLCDGFGYL